MTEKACKSIVFFIVVAVIALNGIIVPASEDFLYENEIANTDWSVIKWRDISDTEYTDVTGYDRAYIFFNDNTVDICTLDFNGSNYYTYNIASKTQSDGTIILHLISDEEEMTLSIYFESENLVMTISSEEVERVWLCQREKEDDDSDYAYSESFSEENDYINDQVEATHNLSNARSIEYDTLIGTYWMCDISQSEINKEYDSNRSEYYYFDTDAVDIFEKENHHMRIFRFQIDDITIDQDKIKLTTHSDDESMSTYIIRDGGTLNMTFSNNNTMVYTSVTADELCENVHSADFYIQEGGAFIFADSLRSYPDNYDEIIAQDWRYVLCRQSVSGFDQNEVGYGIYDSYEKKWTFELMNIPEMQENTSVYSCGDGVFTFSFLDSRGDLEDMFISTKLGDVFSLNTCNYNTEQWKFYDNEALIMLNHGNLGYDEGRVIPSNELVRVDVFGNVTSVNLPDYNMDWVYWENIVSDDIELFFAKYEYNDEQYFYIVPHDFGKAVIVSDQRFTTKSAGEVSYDNTSIISFVRYFAYMTDDIITIYNLVGEDGYLYSVDFNLEGNAISEPERVDENTW